VGDGLWRKSWFVVSRAGFYCLFFSFFFFLFPLAIFLFLSSCRLMGMLVLKSRGEEEDICDGSAKVPVFWYYMVSMLCNRWFLHSFTRNDTFPLAQLALRPFGSACFLFLPLVSSWLFYLYIYMCVYMMLFALF